MDSKNYIQYISSYYMCSKKMAEKLIKSAELNGTKKELDRIAYLKEKELNENAGKYV